MKRTRAVGAAVWAGAIWLFWAAAPARAVFTAEEIAYLEKTEERMQVLFHSLRPDKGDDVNPPAGIVDLLPAMHQKKVWRDPDEGLLSEAKLWQAPASLLYEFFEITRRTFPRVAGGPPALPQTLARHYADNRERFVMALDRLKRADLWDSFDGEGGRLLAAYDGIRKEMDKLVAAVGGDWPSGPHRLPRYRAAVLAVARLSDGACAGLERAAGGEPAEGPR